MALFTDSFNRADGPIGNGWSRITSRWVVSGNRAATLLGADAATRGNELPAGPQFEQIWLESAPATGNLWLILRGQSAGVNNCMFCRIQWEPGSFTAAIYRRVNNVDTTLVANGSIGGSPGGHVYGFEANGDLFTMFQDGMPICSGSDSYWHLGRWFGFGSDYANTYCDDFLADMPAASVMYGTATPPPLLGSTWTIALTNNYNTWVVGTPGTPTFTCSTGTILSQVVNTPSTATLTWTPTAANTTSVTITDPVEPASAVVALSSGVGLGINLSQIVVDYLERSALAALPISDIIANHSTNYSVGGATLNLDTILGDVTLSTYGLVGNPVPVPGVTPSIDALWYILNGKNQPDAENNLYDILMDAWPDIVNTYTSLTALRTNQAYTIQDILDAISDIPTVDLSGVIAKLDAIKGDTEDALTDLTAVLAQLAAIRTPANYTLGSLYTILANLHDVDIPAVYNDTQWLKAWAQAFQTHVYAELDTIYNDTHVLIPNRLTSLEADLDTYYADLRNRLISLASAELNHYNTVNGKLDAISTAITNGFSGLNTKVDAIKTNTDQIPAIKTVTDQVQGWITAAKDAILLAISKIGTVNLPLWPGVANVTYAGWTSGTGDIAVAGPLSGLEIQMTQVPPGIQGWVLNGLINAKWGGHITFYADNGLTEEIQFAATNKRLVLPKSMLTASSAVVHLRAGVTANIRAWTRNP